ncbi:MAG TPA: glutamate--tRNA ligase [Candidatus Angelobacter sp.]|jgi:glutamyl-tRNA synthetase/nondiscriminating glutamyl-tRNA synthetase
MATDKVRVRFAPSPTGELHIGNVRTALYNWLFARKMDGTFILRIEDTDIERSEARYETQLLENLKWLGLDWDEGPDVGGPYPPYRQSDKLGVYRFYAEQLIKERKAYYCFCSAEELELERQAALREQRHQVYSGKCRTIEPEEAQRRVSNGETAAIRLIIPQHPIGFFDIIRGNVQFPNEVISDPIIVRSNGVPTYNFVVVIDDAEMKITHVIRGDDHISNTPKQVAVYEALGFPVPVFAHLSTILGADRERLSKRHGATSVSHFKEMGILPEALMNYLAMLGWAPSGGDREVFRKEELIKEFSLERVTHSPAIFDQEKLSWFNKHYLKESSPERTLQLALPFFERAGFVSSTQDSDIVRWLTNITQLLVPYVDKLTELPHRASIFFSYEAADALEKPENREILENPGTPFILRAFVERIASRSALSAEIFKEIMNEVKDETGVKGKALFHPIRIMLIGSHSGPDFDRLIPLVEDGSKLGLPIRVKNVHERVAEFIFRQISFVDWQFDSTRQLSKLEPEDVSLRDTVSRQTAGPWLEHRGLRALDNLTGILLSRGNAVVSYHLQRWIKDICWNRLGPQDPLTWASIEHFATFLYLHGEFEQAGELQEQLLDTYAKIFGNEHESRLQSLRQLAVIRLGQGKYEEAKMLLDQIVDLRSSRWGREHPDTLTALYDLAQVFRVIGRLPEAQEMHAEVLSLRKEHLGFQHPDTLQSANRVAEDFLRAGDLISAENLQRKVVDLCRESLGREHPLTAESAWILSEIFRGLILRNLTQNLSWLLYRDPKCLLPSQTRLRLDLAALIGRRIEDRDNVDN